MNPTLSEMARSVIKAGLAQCSKGQQDFFKRIYANGNYELNINTVVDRMSDKELDWALTQIQNTIKKNEREDTEFYSHRILLPSVKIALDSTGLYGKVAP
jgi:hypothetical protein